jgi:methylated-DNA-protein-cysteine methyltransferase related protein
MRATILATIRMIPRGKVSTYGAVGRAAGLTHGARQVARNLRDSFDVPWHRVLGAGGEIKLRGDSAAEQRFRLQAEGVAFRGRRVNIKMHEFQFPKARKRPAAARKK